MRNVPWQLVKRAMEGVEEGIREGRRNAALTAFLLGGGGKSKDFGSFLKSMGLGYKDTGRSHVGSKRSEQEILDDADRIVQADTKRAAR